MTEPENRPTGFPLERRCPFDLPVEYAKWRSDEPVAKVRVPDGQEVWLITRHEDVRTLLTDPRISADRRHPNYPHTQLVDPRTRAGIAAVGRSLIGLDPPEHGPRRSMLISEFTLHRVRALRPFVRQVVDDHLDALLAGPRPADLVEAFCAPVPAMVLCELIGVPFADRAFFRSRAEAQVRRSTPPAQRFGAAGELRGYLDELITRKEREPGDDLLGRLIVRDRDTGVFDHGLLVGLAMLLIVAGHDSVGSSIALSAVRLLETPALRDRFVADPDGRAAAVEELLRSTAVVDVMARVAVADVEIGGVTIRAGDGLLMGFASANHDESVFPDATVFDPDRGARHHVAFGYGIHQCLGQNLARVQLDVALTRLFERIPGLRLVGPAAELPYSGDSDTFGLLQLPVTW